MISTRSLVISISLALFPMPLIHAQDLSKYRGFQLGTNLLAVTKQANAKPSEVKMVYQRPAVIQELEWRPQSFYDSSVQQDPVREVLLSFYNGELYRIVVTYYQDRTQGLTDEDLIEGVSVKYGIPTMPTAKIMTSPSSRSYRDTEQVIARWEDSQYSFNLFRSTYGAAPGMLAFSKRLNALAQEAIGQAILLNEQEAPQREIERQKKQDEEKRAAEQKARPLNKKNFRP